MKLIKQLITLCIISLLPISVFAGDEVIGWSEIGSKAWKVDFGVGNATPSWTAPLIVPSGAHWIAFQIRNGTYAQPIGVGSNYIGAVTNATFAVFMAPSLISMVSPHTHDMRTYYLMEDTAGWEFIPEISQSGTYLCPVQGDAVVRIKMVRSGATTAASIIARFDD